MRSRSITAPTIGAQVLKSNRKLVKNLSKTQKLRVGHFAGTNSSYIFHASARVLRASADRKAVFFIAFL